MEYFSLSGTLESAVPYINQNWFPSNETTFLKKHVLIRGVNLLLTPALFISCAIDTIIGLGVGIGAICTLGKHQRTLDIAFNHLSGSAKLVVGPYFHFLHIINPEATFLNESTYKISRLGQGFLSNLVIQPLQEAAKGCYNSQNFLKRHVASRLTYAVLAISCLVTRAVDGIIGIPAAGLSILTGGKFASLNHLAFRTLQAPAIIDDLFYCTIKFINPWAGTLVH